MRNAKTRIYCLCTLILSMVLSACSIGKDKPAATEKPNANITYVKGADFHGVVKAIDSTTDQITFYNTIMDEDETYSYSTATAIRSKNGRDMSMDEVELGEVYQVTNSQDGKKVTDMVEASDIVEVRNAVMTVDSDAGRVRIDETNYAYTEKCIVVSQEKEIDPMEITSSDRVTFRGVKGRAYSMVVTKGHGYVKLANYDDFVGGSMTIKGEAILPISPGMLLTLPEGEQSISLKNAGMGATATIDVKRNQVTKLNVAKYQTVFPDISQVTFDITPAGAELYVDKKLQDYTKPIALKYGNHSVKVVLEGYNDYSGIVSVKDSSAVVHINLAEETAEVSSDDTGETDEQDGSTDTTASDGTETPASEETDDEHQITISAPSGATIYVNGAYKGEVPCSFTKVLGNVTITLSQSGYQTKSYGVEITDDNQDVSWSFPKLEKGSAAG